MLNFPSVATQLEQLCTENGAQIQEHVEAASWHQWQQDGVEVGTIVMLVNRPHLLFNFVNLSCLAACVCWTCVCVLLSLSALNVKM